MMNGIGWSAILIGFVSAGALVIWFIAEHRGWFLTDEPDFHGEQVSGDEL